VAVASYEEAAERTWAHVVERAQAELTESSFSLWFQGVRATSLHDGVLEVVAPSEYVREWLAKNYVELIREAATEALGLPIRVELGSAPPEEAAPQRGTPASSPEPRDPEPTPAQAAATGGPSSFGAPGLPFPNYTFETFVAGPSNRFAHAAAMAVADTPPSKAYNPLFIYGGVGLGKTHLLVAIGHQMFGLSPRLRVK